jgi:alkylhydroperoxidase family enzyme
MMIPSRVASSVVKRQVRYLTPVSAFAATGTIAKAYQQITEEMRLVIPPALLHSPSPQLLSAYWMLVREPLMPTGEIERGTKETIAAAVSVANICPYCVEMHSISMYELNSEQDAEAVADDRLDTMPDESLRAVAAWARTAHEPAGAAALPATATDAGRGELVGTLVSMHYLARMVNVFLTNFLIPPGLGPRARRRFKQGVSRMLRPTLRDPRAAGRALELLPAAPLPESAAWASGHPIIADAVARSYAAFEAAGVRSLAPVVRQLVTTRLASWHGEDTGLSLAWCEDLIADLPVPERAAARLALLTALASYQVGDETITEFRRHHPGDVTLLEAAAWASFAAASLIGARQGGDRLREDHEGHHQGEDPAGRGSHE